MIHGVKVVPLRQIVDERGKIMHMLKATDEHFLGFELQEVFFGEDNYVLVQIPPGIANGYKAYGDKQVIMANAATEPHDPDEMERLDPFTDRIPYDWDLQHG